MGYTHPEALVSTEWLANNLNHDGIVLFDGTSHLPTAGRNAAEEFASKHIPGARRFDIDDIADPASSLPHMLPSAERFASKMGALGVANADHVVVYDVYGLQSAARIWWMMRAFGHDKVSLLDGGLPKWEAEGRPTDANIRTVAPTQFVATLRPELVRSVDDVLANVNNQNEQVADARAAGRFTGEQPEPRAGMRSGHIPQSLCLPFTNLLNTDRTFLPAAQLREVIQGSGVDLTRPLTASCGSGVTACVIALGCHLLGKSDVAIYDGSWSEWGAREDTPIDTGA